MVSINSNKTAMLAHKYLEASNQQAATSAARLSSGNRIISASDDVAGLAVGTILKTGVSTLNAALTNAAQASALLGLTDGALSNVGDILQRQKALASQATSGSLTDDARGFLNQEFQQLKSEVDRIATSTNFNGIKLLDGSLYGASRMISQTKADATSTSSVVQVVVALADAETLVIKTPDDTTGVTFTAKTTPDAAYPDSLLQIDITTNTTQAQQRDALLANIQAIKTYNGTDATMLGYKATLSEVDFSAVSTDSIQIKTLSAGTVNTGASGVVIESTAATGSVFFNGVDIQTAFASGSNTAGTRYLEEGGTAGVNGDLNAGTFSTAGAYGSGSLSKIPSVIAQGSTSDSLLKSITTSAIGTTGVNFANISNNPGFVGNLQGFTAEYVTNEVVNLSIEVGGITYYAPGVNTNYTADTVVTFTASEAGYGNFKIQFAANNGEASISTQAEADKFVTRLNKAFEKVEMFQKRQISSYTAAGTVYPTGSSTASGNLSGTEFWMINNDYSNLSIQDIEVMAPPAGAANATIQITINGEVFESGYDYAGATSALGDNIAANATVGFVSKSNPNKVMVFKNGATQINITSDAEAEGLQKALKEAFGLNSGNVSGLDFQIGTQSSDKINVQIQGTTSKDIYLGSDGVSVDPAINTQADAVQANGILDSAINEVTALRANIGALQSRFNYASATISTSIENQDAARALFLDADIASESTQLAQAQVKLQASISVLAQANQISQSYLKLIG